MSSDPVLLDIREGVAVVTINRPEKRNAMNSDVRRGLLESLRKIEGDDSVSVVILRGAGEHFCAGADLNELYSLDGIGIRRYHREMGAQVIAERIQSLSKIVIAAVDGFCMGGGCEIVQACDLVIATKRAIFGQPEVRVGLVPGGGGTQRLPRIIGIRKAKELMLTGRTLSAEEAEALGLVNRVVEPDKLDEEVGKLVGELRDKSPIILALIKRAVNASHETHLSAGLELERELHFYTWLTEDRREGIRAFLEKRKPSFKGR